MSRLQGFYRERDLKMKRFPDHAQGTDDVLFAGKLP